MASTDVGVGRISPELYPAQRVGVELFKQSGNLSKPRRWIFPWKTGCGKTAAALTSMKELGAHSVLIVCPAIVRNHWLHEIEKWCGWSIAARASIIQWGRKRKLGKRAHELREQAYASPIQIVSYDLLGAVRVHSWDMIIFDEMHHLAQPLSNQSKRALALVKYNQSADILGLSATLIPTEVKQLWNPLRLLFGEKEWGYASRTGDTSWGFQLQYCNTERNQYGLEVWGVKESARDELKARLLKVCYPLSREDISSDLPSLDVHMYNLGNIRGKNGARNALIEWHDSLAEDVTHRVIMVKHRVLAKDVVENLNPPDTHVCYIDGSIPTNARDFLLQRCRDAPRATLVCTWESLSEGIRLMWAQQVAIAEWPSSPGPMVQLLGRFNSIGSNARPQVSLMTTSDTYGAGQTLLARTRAVMDALGKARNESELTALLSEEGDRDIPASEWLQMLNSQTPENWEDGDDTGEGVRH